MRLRASATPIDAPAPTPTPPPTAIEIARTSAWIADVFVAVTITSPALAMLLSAM